MNPTVAFAEIDWHDYAIVQTIEFTAMDANSELPPPMSVQEVENMTLAQKRMAAMIMENTAEDVEAHRARQAAAEAEAAAAVGNAGTGGDDDAAMEESDDEEDTQAKQRLEEEERAKEIAHAQALQAGSVNTAGPMKIRTDYVPKCERPSWWFVYLWFFNDEKNFLSGCKKCQGCHHHMYNLWTANSRR